jgi:hypothetical protein
MSGAIRLNMPEAEYHSHPALSSTQARLLLDSPAKYKYALTHPQEHKDAFDLGTAVHSKVLGVGAQSVVLDFPDMRTKAAREARDEARAAGQIVLSPADMAKVDGMAEAVLAHPVARALFEQEGNSEASVFATDPTTGMAVRARFDFLPSLDLPNPIAVDLKTTAKSASKEGFNQSVRTFRYEVQEAHYADTLQFAVGADIPFVFCVVETEAPHLVNIHQLDMKWREMGHDQARRARELMAECTEKNEWPGFPPIVNLLSPPVYAVYEHEEKYA